MSTPERETAIVPPYVSFKTFSTFLRSLGQHVPARIDKSVMPSMSGGAQSQILQALKYLKLIDADGKPTDKLAPLVTSEGVDYQNALRAVLKGAYPFMSGSSFQLGNASPKMLDDEFSKLASGDTVRKCVTFFIPAAVAAGIPLSPHIKQPRKRTTTNGKARKQRKNPAAADQVNREEQPPLTDPRAMSWHQLLLSKFPSFDPSWPDDVKSKWFESFADLMKKGGPE